MYRYGRDHCLPRGKSNNAALLLAEFRQGGQRNRGIGKMPKVLVTIGVLVFGAIIPILEISPTHVFNPDWTPHVRFHEVWQLMTNSALAALSLWLVWRRNEIMLASVIGLCVMGGILASHALSGFYGGSLTYPGGLDQTVLGLHITVVIPLVSVLLFGSAMIAVSAKSGGRP